MLLWLLWFWIGLLVMDGGLMSKPKTLKPKKCKSCGIEFTPKNSLQKVCSPKCALDLTRQNAQKAQERAEKKKQRERKAKLKSRSEWLK